MSVRLLSDGSIILVVVGSLCVLLRPAHTGTGVEAQHPTEESWQDVLVEAGCMSARPILREGWDLQYVEETGRVTAEYPETL